MNRRFALEMYELPSDRAVAMCIGLVGLAVLAFTGAGSVLWSQLAAYVATWGVW